MTNQNNTQPEWWEDQDGFFGPGYLEEYTDHLNRARLDEEVRFLEKLMDITNGTPIRKPPQLMSVLDVPCGHGRHSYELATRHPHVHVTGVDLNRYFLDIAEEEVRIAAEWHPIAFDLDERATYLQGDMRELTFEEKFDFALNLFTAMGYFDTDREDERFFAGVYRALKPGGKFVVDYLNRDRLLKNFQKSSVASDWNELTAVAGYPQSASITLRRFDPVRGYMYDRRIVLKDGEVVRNVTSRIRFYTPSEIIAMARRVGFVLERTYGDFIGNPLTTDSKRAILVFEKLL